LIVSSVGTGKHLQLIVSSVGKVKHLHLHINIWIVGTCNISLLILMFCLKILCRRSLLPLREQDSLWAWLWGINIPLSINVYTLSVSLSICIHPFVSNKRQNGWTDKGPEFRIGPQMAPWITKLQIFGSKSLWLL